MSRLTPRQREILVRHADGATFAEIGRELFLSRSTVRSEASELRRSLGARSMCHAIVLAQHHGDIHLAQTGCLETVQQRQVRITTESAIKRPLAVMHALVGASITLRSALA